MITSLNRQGGRRYPQMRGLSVQVVWLPAIGTTATEEAFTEVVTIAGLSLANQAVISGLKLERQVTVVNLAVGS